MFSLHNFLMRNAITLVGRPGYESTTYRLVSAFCDLNQVPYTARSRKFHNTWEKELI